MIWKSISAVLSIFLMIGLGMLVAKLKWLTKDTAQAIPKIIVNISLPANLIATFFSNFSRQQLMQSWIYILVSMVASVVCCIVAYGIARIIKIPNTRRGVFCVLFALSNSVFIGFPIANAIFGAEGMQYAAFFYIANTICFWTFGYYMIKKDGEHISGKFSKTNLLSMVKKVLSVPMITLIICFILILLNIKMPEILLTTAQHMGGLTTPLATLFLGVVLYDMGLSAFRYEKGMAFYVLGRFPISFGIMYLSCMLFDVTGLARNVLLTQMSLPAMIQTVVTSDLLGADSDYAARGLAVTTVLSLVTIPLFSFLGA